LENGQKLGGGKGFLGVKQDQFWAQLGKRQTRETKVKRAERLRRTEHLEEDRRELT